ncbi:DUF433 domain-containing protein [candidate division KSB1 bacterium]|nr:DUF433 domain-containing protein [candidate division KSB1 bacterium]
MKRKEFGKYIVADPAICHGKLTFKGTRIFVKDVVEMVADGMDWDKIIEEWRGSIDKDAISEAIKIAGDALEQKSEKYTQAA